MKSSSQSRKRILAIFGMFCVAAILGFSRWRHPALPGTFPLPVDARVTYSLRYFNPLMTGPALYYRIESSHTQRKLATNIHRGFDSELQVITRDSPSLRQAFKQVALRDGIGDRALAFTIKGQEFPVESDPFCQCHVWQTTQGSVAEIFVWTKF